MEVICTWPNKAVTEARFANTTLAFLLLRAGQPNHNQVVGGCPRILLFGHYQCWQRLILPCRPVALGRRKGCQDRRGFPCKMTSAGWSLALHNREKEGETWGDLFNIQKIQKKNMTGFIIRELLCHSKFLLCVCVPLIMFNL